MQHPLKLFLILTELMVAAQLNRILNFWFDVVSQGANQYSSVPVSGTVSVKAFAPLYPVPEKHAIVVMITIETNDKWAVIETLIWQIETIMFIQLCPWTAARRKALLKYYGLWRIKAARPTVCIGAGAGYDTAAKAPRSAPGGLPNIASTPSSPSGPCSFN